MPNFLQNPGQNKNKCSNYLQVVSNMSGSGVKYDNWSFFLCVWGGGGSYLNSKK